MLAGMPSCDQLDHLASQAWHVKREASRRFFITRSTRRLPTPSSSHLHFHASHRSRLSTTHRRSHLPNTQLEMASFPRAKVDSSTQTDPPLPFTALLDRALDRVEATVPLNLSSITFYIRRHHLSRIEQIEGLLSDNLIFKILFQRIGLDPQHVFSVLCLLTLYGCRQLYRRSVYLTTNLCAVAYPAYCSIKTINSDPISPPPGLGLEPAERNPLYAPRYRNSTYSSTSSIRSSRRKSRRRMSNMEDSMQSGSNSFSGGNSSQEDYESSRRSVISSSWGRPSDYSNYSEDNFTTTSGGSGSMTVEEKMRQRMRRRWAKFSNTHKEKATRQWLAYWSIYGTVQVLDTWSSFLLDWIPGYNLGKLIFLWWAQRRGATLIFDYFQPLIQAKNKEGREVARKPSNRSLRSEYSRHERGGGGGSQGGSSRGGSRPGSMQVFPDGVLQQEPQEYHQRQYEQYYDRGSTSRRGTRDSNKDRRRREDYYEDEDEDMMEDVHHKQEHLRQPAHHQPMSLHRELMTSSPHDSGSFAETSLFESAESVWSAPPGTASVQAVGEAGLGAAFHSNNGTPTPMSVHEQYQRQHHLHRQSPQKPIPPPEPTSYAASSTIHWNPSTSNDAPTE